MRAYKTSEKHTRALTITKQNTKAHKKHTAKQTKTSEKYAKAHKSIHNHTKSNKKTTSSTYKSTHNHTNKQRIQTHKRTKAYKSTVKITQAYALCLARIH